MPDPSGNHYWWQIMLPGSVLGGVIGSGLVLPDDPSMVANDPLPAFKEGGGKSPTPFLFQFVSISRREYPIRSTRSR